jgi:UDP-N-acetylglucosamine 4,6-dehydratase
VGAPAPMPRPAREFIIVFDGARILITGGTGSFGRQFARGVLQRHKPARLVVFSRDEMKQYEMRNDSEAFAAPCLRFFIGDVRDANRLEMALRGIDYVVHAAALKQVPAAEYNPFECLHTNVLGAENVVNASIRAGVRKVIALSTDKAVNPVNLYGASKLAADKIFVAANNLSGADGTRFSVVRYGNVLGSRGSVVPLFQRLARSGATSMPITDPRMTRFWITVQRGADFVMSSLERMRGGEIFVPKIPSMKIIDLARCIAPDIPHKVVGIRPGEKLHETMITEDDARTTFEFEDHYIIEPAFKDWTTAPMAGQGGRRVAEEFRYSSDENPAWLDAAQLAALLKDARA